MAEGGVTVTGSTLGTEICTGKAEEPRDPARTRSFLCSLFEQGQSLRTFRCLSMAAITIEQVSTDVDRIVSQVPSTDPSTTCDVPHTSPPPDAALSLADDTTTTAKKKKKKKSKKSAKSKSEPNVKPLTEDDEPGPLVLRISRNKHWRYISSYHVCSPTWPFCLPAL